MGTQTCSLTGAQRSFTSEASKLDTSKDRRPGYVYGYVRVSTGHQDLASQRLGIVDFATKHGLRVKFVEEKVGGSVPIAERTLGRDLLPVLRPGDTLLVSELSRLGRSLLDVLSTLKTLTERDIAVYDIKGAFKYDASLNARIFATMLSLAAEIERELLRARTIEGQMRARKAGKHLGRPKGSGGHSKLDQHADQIRQLAVKGVSIAALSRVHDCSWLTMSEWLRRHNVRIAKAAA